MSVNAACVGSGRGVSPDVRLDMPEYLGGTSRSPSLAESIDSQPAVAWRRSLGRGIAGTPAASARVILVTTVDRWIYALDASTGATLWRARGDAPYTSGPVAGGDRLYVASGGAAGRVTALRLRDGRRLWQTQVGDVSAPLTLRDTVVYGATQAGSAFALSATRGRVLWRRPVGATRSGPLVLTRHIAIATLSDSLIVLDRATGTIAGRVGVQLSTMAPLASAAESTVVLASPGGEVAAATLPRGGIRWRVTTGEPIFGAPVIVRDTVFALGRNCTIFRIPLAAPNELRRAAIRDCLTVASPLVLQNGVVVATLTGDLVFGDRDTGAVRWRMRVGRELRHPGVVIARSMVVPTTDGELVVLR